MAGLLRDVVSTVIIAVDGPGGSGKSTVSRRLAGRLGWNHLDTGAFYRAATLTVLRSGVDPNDVDEVDGIVLARAFVQEDGRMCIDGRDVSVEIRTPEVTAAVSAISALPTVRRAMVAQQREWVQKHGPDVVVEGRDIGTVVFPEADLKVWLSASAEERAKRRALQSGEDPATVLAELAIRDRADSGRTVSPLEPADDAIHVDTTDMTIEEVVDHIVGLLQTRNPGLFGLSDSQSNSIGNPQNRPTPGAQ
jgi:cytidylate kinase